MTIPQTPCFYDLCYILVDGTKKHIFNLLSSSETIITVTTQILLIGNSKDVSGQSEEHDLANWRLTSPTNIRNRQVFSECLPQASSVVTM